MDELDRLLGIDVYLERIFRVEDEVAAAEREVLYFEEGRSDESAFGSVDDASSWARRVARWRANLLRDLRSDSVPVLWRHDMCWMFHASGDLHICPSYGTIQCKLCRKCTSSLRRCCFGMGCAGYDMLAVTVCSELI